MSLASYIVSDDTPWKNEIWHICYDLLGKKASWDKQSLGSHPQIL